MPARLRYPKPRESSHALVLSPSARRHLSDVRIPRTDKLEDAERGQWKHEAAQVAPACVQSMPGAGPEMMIFANQAEVDDWKWEKNATVTLSFLAGAGHRPRRCMT
jgi:hypothetical protein